MFPLALMFLCYEGKGNLVGHRDRGERGGAEDEENGNRLGDKEGGKQKMSRR